MSSADDAEVLIVGGGIAGSALAITLARAGHGVTIIEKSLKHIDRVRGEWIAPGVSRKPSVWDCMNCW